MTEITVELLDAPHRDIPDGSKLFAQIIINNVIFAQTCPFDNRNDSWNLTIECEVYVPVVQYTGLSFISCSPPSASIALVREWPTNVPRLLGTVNLASSDQFAEIEGRHCTS